MTYTAIYRQIMAAIIVSMTALASGLAYGWSSPVLPRLHKPGSIIPMTPDESSWIVVCMELGSFLIALPAGIIIDKFGRKNTLMICVVPFALSWTIVILTRSVTMLYLCKLTQGVCMGTVLCACPIYIAEISQPSIRGMLSTSLISMWYAGLILAYTVGSYTAYDTTAYVSLTTSIIYILPLYFLPESPYFYFMKARRREAVKSLSYYRDKNLTELTDEISSIEEYVNKEKSDRPSLLSLFTEPIPLRCLFIISVINIVTVFTGITATYAYSTKIFSTTSHSATPEQYSIIISVIFFLTNFLTTFLIDKVGRRVIVLVSCVGCFFSNSTAAIFFYVESKMDVTPFQWAPLIIISSYCIFVSVGLNPLANSFQGELFPANTRSIASGFNAFTIAITSSTCLKLFYINDTYIGMYFNYVMFAFFAGLGAILLYIYMPETKDKTFAQIQRELKQRYKIVEAQDDELMDPVTK
uniref:Major facilitator superfamily (MFS) profile domain-containing protein n=1 Tax=Clastoptera arizonana TaxID=38151 RepID=A0A1B6DVS5_9HEMI